MSCEDFEVPDGLTSSNYDNLFFVRVAGSISGVNINETVRVKVIKRIGKVFLQTDKEIYKPGQLVQFRVLTLEGVYLNVSTESVSFASLRNFNC
ncbi:hypothetical protein FHG87_004064 [Trinorchestia longiramus]|nr:hypothetical protein FHG87_004064 [Trinorchestia longiramus]